MHGQNYATDVLDKIDGRFFLESKTNAIVNNGIEMEFSNGNNAVTIYDMDVVPENDYQRSGTMRYGQLVEIGNQVQTFVLSQDKSFAISIDRGNREDSKMVPAIDDAVERQVREVSIPTTDIYRLSILTAYAVANSQTATNALAYNDIFQKILVQRAALINAKVKLEDIVCYVNPTTESYLWRDPEFKTACDKTTEDRATGVIGTVMGMTIVVCPDSYYVANFGFMLVSKKVLAAPTKFNEIKTGDGFPFGISGMVAFGRRYYDAFIPRNKGVAIRLHLIA
jgi:hypothetical protein